MKNKEKIEYEIRPAEASDLPSIDAINQCAWEGGITSYELLECKYGPVGKKNWTELIKEAISGQLNRRGVKTFVAVSDDRIIGYSSAFVDLHSPAKGEISYNAVHPEYRGNGIGRALIDQAIAWLKNGGARIIALWTLESDEPVCRLYEKIGFKKLTRFVYYSMETGQL